MSRWHLQSCTEPDVVVHNSVPSCRTCKASPDLEGLVDQQKRLESESGQPWTVPKDEPIGEMNLFWPECVQYVGRRDQDATDHDEQQAINKSQSTESSKAQYASAEPYSSPGNKSHSCIYERPLSDNEFRLVYLSAANHCPGVIHITLETYSNDDYPEYEAVSYAWGVEDGVSDQRHPVYVGVYWDVMLHTKNCWSLLAYLQPRRGIRLVWIDSLSINQRDNEEKVVQVRSMGERYRKCTRVVVYLGPGYVDPSTTGSHRRRAPFHEMPDDTFQRILLAPYFGRIWIVQELVMAPSAIIPVNDTDFVVGGDTVVARLQMRQDQRLNGPERPWFAQLCTGGTIQHEAQSAQLISAMHLTRDSESSDPRDRIFGILGLIRADTFSAANYDISTAHVSIGVFSHCILNLKRIGVLVGAPRLRNAELGYPSWLPDWKSSITFTEIGYPIEAPMGMGLYQALQDFAHEFLLHGTDSRRSERMEATQHFLPNPRQAPSGPINPFSCDAGCPYHQVLRVIINEHHDEMRRHQPLSSEYTDKRALFSESHHKWWGGSYLDHAGIPWDEGAYICSSSGALSLHLTHLLHFTTNPDVINRFDICFLRIRSDASSNRSNLFLSTLPNPTLDFSNLGPGRKDLFLLPGTENRPSLVLFLKLNTGGNGFQLLGCRYCLDLFFMTPNHSKAGNQPTSSTEIPLVSMYRKVQVIHREMESLEGRQIIRKPWDPLYTESIPDPPPYSAGFEVFSYQPLFQGEEWSPWDVLFMVQGLLNQKDSKPGSFFARYHQKQLSKAGKGNNPELVGEYLGITTNLFKCVGDRPSGMSLTTFQRYVESFLSGWEVEVVAGAWVRAAKLLDRRRRQKFDVENARLRIPMNTLEQLLSNSVFYRILRQVTPYSRKTGVDEYEILRGGPKEEYRSEFSLDFPEEIQKAFNVDMWTRMVTIV